MKPVLDALDRSPQDELLERIEKEAVSKKYWVALGGSILLLLGTMLINGGTMLKKQKIQPAPLLTVVKKDGVLDPATIQQVPLTLEFPHQSFKNVSNWIEDAIGVTYSFGFLNIDQQIEKAEFYFTPAGYETYKMALNTSGVRKEIIEKKLEVSTITMQEPVLINGGINGDTEFWRFRVPVLVSFSGGKEAVIEKRMVELLVLRVPSYLSHKGLAIAEYNMTIM
jgi:hypothetical protein